LTDYYLLPEKLTANEWGEWRLTSFWVSSVVGKFYEENNFFSKHGARHSSMALPSSPGSSVCFLFGAGSSILAPPGIFLLDGPGVNPP
jgi:hypothetical protein